MNYEYIKKITEGHTFPLSGTSDKGEPIIVEEGRTEDGEHYYRVEIAQDNDWIRVEEYYSDGTVTESYEK